MNALPDEYAQFLEMGVLRVPQSQSLHYRGHAIDFPRSMYAGMLKFAASMKRAGLIMQAFLLGFESIAAYLHHLEREAGYPKRRRMHEMRAWSRRKGRRK